MTKLIVVLGATGVQGGSVIKEYLKDPGYKIRAITRNPESSSSQKLKDTGVEVVKADIYNVNELVEAFKGAQVIFSTTDFFAGISDPSVAKNLRPGELIGEKGYEAELSQGHNIIKALNNVVSTTLEKIILSTLSAASRHSNNKYKHIFHFDSKAAMVDEIKKHPDLAAKTVYLQLGFYVTNWSLAPMMRPKLTPKGTWEMTVPGDPYAKHPIVWAEKETGKFTRALEKEKAGTILLGFSEMVSYQQWMDVWGKVNSVQTACRRTSIEEWDQQMEHGLGAEIAETYLYSEEFGFDGGEVGVKRPADLNINNLTTIEEYIKSVDWKNERGFETLLSG